MRQAARKSRLRTGFPVRNGVGNCKKTNYDPPSCWLRLAKSERDEPHRKPVRGSSLSPFRSFAIQAFGWALRRRSRSAPAASPPRRRRTLCGSGVVEPTVKLFTAAKISAELAELESGLATLTPTKKEEMST